ncbi:ALS2 C-terminal-like protein [Thomomys bottae]
MASSEEIALFQLEEVFSATLARIDSLILQPLLSEVEPESSSDPRGREFLQLLHRLHECTQHLWEVTDQSLHSLQRRVQNPSCSLKTLLLLGQPDQIQKAHREYIESYTNCIVVPAFQRVIKRRSEYWRGQRNALRQILAGGNAEGSLGTMLAQALHQPLAQHVQQYLILLLRLRERLEEEHSSQEMVMKAISLFGDLQSFMSQALDQAVATQGLWDTLSSRLRDTLCTPGHRLLLDSQDVPVTVAPLRAERGLLFDDTLVLLQGHNVCTFDLKLVWVESGQKECVCHIVTPEEVFSLCARDPKNLAIWRRKMTLAVCQALRGNKDFPMLGTGLDPDGPLDSRQATYTFQQEGRLCQATYEGDWFRGKPHGKGTLKWPDGRNFVGGFHQGLEQGFGIHLLPRGPEDQFDCYKCHWRKGHMCGYGMCEYATGDIYKGYFQVGLRHGFGVLDSVPQAFRYTGHWEKGQRSGFGVQDDNDRGERYIGMWQADQRHGPGIVISQAGICYQGTFQQDKMAGPGICLTEDGSLYEGTVTNDLIPMGKGKVTFPNGFVLEGWFGSWTGKGLPIQGVLDTASFPLDSSSTWKRQLSVGAFPKENHWQGVFEPFWAFVHEGCPGELQEALLGFYIQRSKGLQKSQENLCCLRSHQKGHPDDMKEILEDVLRHREPEALQPFLREVKRIQRGSPGKRPEWEGKRSHWICEQPWCFHLGNGNNLEGSKPVLSNSQHPLGKLLQTLLLTFQATYTGIGASKHLQALAKDQVKQHARDLWAAYRALLRVALDHKGQTLKEEDEETRNLQVHGVMLPAILSSFYSELSTLYLLLHEREDSLYQQGLTSLSLLPDATLLNYLWPLKDIKLTSNRRSPLVTGTCFLAASQSLQKILTTVDPQEKLEVLEKTYEEIEAAVTRIMGYKYKLSTDDLLPLLIYVVSRARIQHLGAEIHLIRDLMDSRHLGGLYDFLLTTLESCYRHIQKEDLKSHSLSISGTLGRSGSLALSS